MAGSRGSRVGRSSEMLVQSVLACLKSRGRIANFHKARENMPGYDFFVLLPDCRIVFLQVKSSAQTCERHKKKYPDIPVVVVPEHPVKWASWPGLNDAKQVLANRILEALGIKDSLAPAGESLFFKIKICQ